MCAPLLTTHSATFERSEACRQRVGSRSFGLGPRSFGLGPLLRSRKRHAVFIQPANEGHIILAVAGSAQPQPRAEHRYLQIAALVRRQRHVAPPRLIQAVAFEHTRIRIEDEVGARPPICE